ncbi:hypothetical protein EG329_001886 [Mollisiaceae sp. DMI_Dod_QoI]|nr:hypothetical protein EG329_001886 [Helotiales sp. DMI_Dod_QoI]
MTMATLTETQTEQPEYVYFHYDGDWGHKREVLKGDKKKKTFTEIPVIDVSGIWSDDFKVRLKVANEVAEACESCGFFYVKNHGIDQKLIEETIESNKRYFAKPLEVKMREHIYKSRTLRGYEPVHGAKLDMNTKLGDRKESFLYNYDPEEDPIPPTMTDEQRALLSENLWPEDDSEFKRECFAYHTALITYARKMMQIFALGLGESEDYFDEYITAPNTSCKKILYPPQEVDNTDETGIGAHTDFVCKVLLFFAYVPGLIAAGFTTLYQDSVGGLEALNANGEWIPAVPIPGTFVVNIGDFLMRMSNNRFLSTVHRVKNISGRERHAMPFFFSLNMDAPVKVLPSCQSESNPAKYEPITVAEYYRQRHEKQRRKHVQREAGLSSVS